MSIGKENKTATDKNVCLEYSHVIVGGGSAGAVLASRLSENPAFHILLLEAGEVFAEDKYPELLSNSQIIAGNGNPTYDWGYQSVPNDEGHVISIPRGKVLGGSSAVNAAVALRGIPNDFKRFANMGLGEWAWEEVLPYYKKLEKSNMDNQQWHGHTGYLPINQLSQADLSPMQAAFMKAAQAKKYDHTTDFNGHMQYGVGAYPVNIINGLRMNTGMTYLNQSVRQRVNLTIMGQVLADRILFKNGKATSVLAADGRIFSAENIILSSGTYGTAAILQRSGIGPKDLLQPLGIPVIADLPVGKNFVDHPFYFNSYAADLHQIGSLTPVTGVNLWTRSSYAEMGDLDIHITAGHLFDPEQSPTKAGFVIGIALTNPKSKGFIKITSHQAEAPLLIDLNFLSVEEDRQRLLQGFKLSRELAQTAPLKDLALEELTPGSQVNDDEQIMKIIKQNLQTYNHPVASAPMGLKGSRVAVVDAWGNVHGLKGLRVVDASILPDFISSGTNVTVIMAAEKIADEIKRVALLKENVKQRTDLW